GVGSAAANVGCANAAAGACPALRAGLILATAAGACSPEGFPARRQTMIKTMTQPERTEGPVARELETRTSRIPSDWFLWTAVAAVGTSFALQVMNKRERSLFFGQWVPTLLLLGV